MIGEFDIGGVFIPSAVVWAVVAIVNQACLYGVCCIWSAFIGWSGTGGCSSWPCWRFCGEP